MNFGDDRTVKRTIGDQLSGAHSQANTGDRSLTGSRFAYFSDKYEFLGVIGEGGMGVVYKARQIHLNRLVAIKTLNTTGFSDQALKRFEREAKAASGLLHPNLITIRDYGVDNHDQPYMIFDFINGVTLAELIKRHGQIELDKALDIFLQVAKGLSYAHQHGVLHRDIKPSNIIISADYREVKIVDFGIAKVLDSGEGGQKLTQTGEIFGTPLYMSPEQSAGKILDARSDLYSMGCVMFEALTAIPPLVGESAIATIIKHQNEIPPTLREVSLGKEFPPALEGIVAKLLAKNPDARYQKADEVIEDLRSIKRPSTADLLAKAGSTTAASQSTGKAKRPSKSSTLLLAVTLLVLTAIVLTTATVMRMNRLSQPAAKKEQKANNFAKEPKFAKETTALDLSGRKITKDLVRQLDQFRNLKELVWRNSEVTPGALLHLPGVSVLDLSGSKVSDNDVNDADIHYGPAELILDGTKIHDASMRNLGSDLVLQVLSLNKTGITDVGLDGMHLGRKMLPLRVLRLVGDNISDTGLGYMKSFPWLEELDLHESTGSITPKGIASLSSCFGLSKLSISLDKSLIEPISRLGQLRDLSIYSETVSDDDLSQLKALPYLAKLSVISDSPHNTERLKQELKKCRIELLRSNLHTPDKPSD
jgi:serine/threonine protein kinase